MSIGRFNPDTATSSKSKQYASGGARNLVADSPGGGLCARKIVLLASGDLTSCKDGSDLEMGPFSGLPAGFEHVGSFSEVNATVAFIAYW